jgi:hypothetical protein
MKTSDSNLILGTPGKQKTPAAMMRLRTSLARLLFRFLRFFVSADILQ